MIQDTFLEEFNWLFKVKTHIKSMYGWFIELIFYPTPAL